MAQLGTLKMVGADLGLKITVRIYRTFMLRMKIATALVRLASWVSPIEVELVRDCDPRT